MAYGTLLTDTIKSSTSGPVAFQNTSGTEIGTLCRAWVSFTGSTGAIRGSFNVSSITRSATGKYVVNITNALSDINYSVVACPSPNAGYAANPAGTVLYSDASSIIAPTTTAFALLQFNAGYSGYIDPVYMNVSVFR